jgi:PAS domain S-box-containing protein
VNPAALSRRGGLVQQLSEARATIEALLSGQIDAVVDPRTATPVLLGKAQEALRQSEEQYRQIVEATSDGIMKLDVAARVVFVNGRLAEMLGYHPSQMIRMNVFSFMSAAAKVVLADSFQQRPLCPQEAVDTIFCHRDGTEISVNVTATALIDGEGRHIGTLGVIRDVTERKKLQSQLMVSDRMASVGTLAAGVAHEINNPLAAVIGNLDYVAETLERIGPGASTSFDPERTDARLLDEIKGPLDDAREAATRVRLIVRDLKIFSRSPIEEPRSRVDVKTVMESSLRMASNEIRHRAHLIERYEAVPSVEVNEGRLGQVFLNLIVNAAQSLPEGRAEDNEIRVSTRLRGDRVVVEVSDTGAGIPPEIIGRIFDAFFTTKGVGVGTGLGLAICHRIVTDMGGDLTVESEVGKGTTFRLALPRAGQEATVAGAPGLAPVSVLGRRGRILVVDDEELVLRSVKRLLAKEHDVVAIASAKLALALLAGGATFDLILCDLMMPDMTGMDLHRELSRVEPDQARRMIFLTGGAFTATAWQFLSEMDQEHLEKPFAAAALRATVRQWVR